MQMMKWSVMALAIAAATTQMAYADVQDDAAPTENLSSQAKSNGIVEDSTLNLLSRNYYFNRDYKNDTTYDANGKRDGQSYTEQWAQGEMLELSSGFTQGTVGFGVDAFGYMGIKLDTGDGRTSGTAGLLQQETKYDAAGEAVGEHANDSYGTAGAAVKARVSETVLKYGDQRTTAPVFSTSDSRLLPETATGFNLMSEEITGLKAEAGHFTAFKDRNGTDHEDNFNGYSGVAAESISYVGATYAVTDEVSTSLYASELQDFWRQYYGNLNFTHALADDQTAAIDFNIYRTNNYGDALAGNIGNTTLSVAPSYTLGAHKFTVAYQHNDGNSVFDYVGGDSVFIANSIQVSDFAMAGEESWKAKYDLDMTSFGVPGLTFMAQYVTGFGADTNNHNVYNDSIGDTRGGNEWEQNFEAKYVVQDGAAKDLALRLREAVYRSDAAAEGYQGGDNNEVRVIIEYPLSIL